MSYLERTSAEIQAIIDEMREQIARLEGPGVSPGGPDGNPERRGAIEAPLCWPSLPGGDGIETDVKN